MAKCPNVATGLYALRGLKAPRPPQWRRSFRCAPFPRHCSGTVCRPWSLLRKALIRAAKTSPTAGTFDMRSVKKIMNSTNNKAFSENMRTLSYTKPGHFFIENLRYIHWPTICSITTRLPASSLLDLFNNHLNQPVIVYNSTHQSHPQRMPVSAMSPLRI
jgi:hypothetical protein